MADIEITSNLMSTGYIFRAAVDQINASVLEEVTKEVPKQIAAMWVQQHSLDILERINVNEVVTLIAAAVAQKVADAYRPKEEGHGGIGEGDT